MKLVPFVVELFSGSARFSRAAARQGWLVIAFDWRNGKLYDLSHRPTQRTVSGRIQARWVAFVLAGMPCQSWSRARMQPGGLQMLRSYDELMGMAELKYESERGKILNGNEIMFFSVRVATACLAVFVPFALENPWPSLIWLTKGMTRLAAHCFVQEAWVDFCMYGKPWRKSTKFLLGFCNPAFLERKCRNGVCLKSGHPHQLFSGRHPVSKVFWTALAEPYPRGLCTNLVRMFEAAVAQLQHNKLPRLLQF